MNWKNGLLRIWLLFSGLWIVAVAYFAGGIFLVPAPFYGTYQHSGQTKDMPWNIDWSKPYYETHFAPGKIPGKLCNG